MSDEKTFRIVLRGSNFLGRVDDVEQNTGFYVGRVALAPTARLAYERSAASVLEEICAHPAFVDFPQEHGIIEIDEIEEVNREVDQPFNTSFIFFDMEEG